MKKYISSSTFTKDEVEKYFNNNIFPLQNELKELKSEKENVNQEKRDAEKKLKKAIEDAEDITEKINKVKDMGKLMTVLTKSYTKYDPSTHKINNLQHYN